MESGRKALGHHFEHLLCSDMRTACYFLGFVEQQGDLLSALPRVGEVFGSLAVAAGGEVGRRKFPQVFRAAAIALRFFEGGECFALCHSGAFETHLGIITADDALRGCVLALGLLCGLCGFRR